MVSIALYQGINCSTSRCYREEEGRVKISLKLCYLVFEQTLLLFLSFRLLSVFVQARVAQLVARRLAVPEIQVQTPPGAN